MYILKKHDDIGEGDKTEVLATLETLNPRCNVDSSLELKQKDTKNNCNKITKGGLTTF
ncbi:hypothetical protein [Campylobacter sp.]|uniref:hypothetical protein n=1 Tax=Campylobacter sp. TaxID=205 RepID=UPI003F9F911A